MINHKNKSFHFYLTLFLFLVVASVQRTYSQCPTLNAGDENQAFCDADNPRVIDLVATDQGGGVVWYANLTGGTPLTDNIVLVDTNVYYVDDATASCATRLAVTVSISGEPPTNVDVAVSRCSSDTNTINELSANGSNIQWYSEQNLGMLLSATTPLASGVTYWVQQTEGVCTSIRLPTTVTIIDPGAPTGDLEQFFCFDSDNPVNFVVADLSATGTDINWYISATATSPLDPSTPLIDNATYYATQTTFPCESSGRFATIVRIDNLPDSGTNNTSNFCDNTTASVNLFGELGGNPDAGGNWTGPQTTTNGDQGTLDTSLLDFGVYVFTYTIPGVNACPDVSATVTINVQEEPDAGEDGVLEICTNEPTVDLFGLLGGTPHTGGTWSPTLDSGTNIFNPAVDTSATYTYTVAPTSPCTLSDTATITVTVEQAPVAGSDATLDLCDNDAATNLFTLLIGADAGGTWSPALTSGTGVFDPAVDAAGDYTYTLDPTATCPGDESIVTVNVSPQPFAGDDSSIELCTNDTTVDLFTLLGGTPSTGGTWSPALASGTGIYDPAVDAGVAYTYAVPALGTCPADDAIVTVTLNILPNAGSDAVTTVCGDAAAFDLFPLLGVGANTGGTWTGPSTVTNGDTGTFDPAVNSSGAYIYTSVGSGACEDLSATVIVTVINPTPTLPTDGEIFCIADTPLISDLIARVIPEMAGTIQVYTSATGTTPLAITDVLIASDTYFVSETDVATSCEGTNRLSVTIQINDPQAPILSNSNAEFCLINTPTISDLNAFVAQGNNVVWVDAAIGGNQFSETDLLVSGDYYAIEEDINGCRSVASTVISIVINDNPAPTLNPNGNELCGVEMPTIAELEANLTTESGLTVVWYDMAQGGIALNTTDLLIDNSTYYAATFNAVTGCESNNRLEIIIDLTVCDLDQYPLLLPDGFSPNGDGINDTYDLRDVEFLFENYTIEIYNRYGNLIFMGNDSIPPWDGTSNQPGAAGNKLVPNGVYFYIFNFNRNNVSPKQGRIYLNR